MKFGRYLAENLTPEWKRAYIDYRACKKAIKVIANRLDSGVPVSPGEQRANTIEGVIEADKDSALDDDDDDEDDDDVGPTAPPRRTPSLAGTFGSGARRRGSGQSPDSGTNGRGSMVSPRLPRSAGKKSNASPGYGAIGSSPRYVPSKSTNPPPLDIGESSYEESSTVPGPKRSGLGQSSIIPSNDTNDGNSKSSSDGSKSSEDGQHALKRSDSGQHLTADTLSRVKQSPNIGKSPRFLNNSNSPRAAGSPKPSTPKSPPQGRRSLRSMTLPSPRVSRDPRTANTFDDLYDTLEADEKAFFDLLALELDKVESFYSDRVGDAQRRAHDLRDQLRELAEHRKVFHEIYPNGLPEWEAKVGRLLPVGGVNPPSLEVVAKQIRKRLPFIDETEDAKRNGHSGNENPESGSGGEEQRKQRLREAMKRDMEHHTYNPERYQKYKRDLRNATMEFYRELELIKNYRIMNLTGFRKALKKFEKISRVHCLEMYTDERISRRSFAKGKVIDDLLVQVEGLYTEHFEHGDQKKARDKLRRQQREKTHYFSVFRSGICLGLALPAAILALVKACEEETRELIPGWNGLLQIYGGFYIAVIFALLFQLNLDAYVATRINYEFVMELSRPTLDYRSYAEIPAFLFLTLSYCFFFTFYRVAPNSVDPTTWPLAWLIFVCVFFLNPLDILRRRSRYWFLRVLLRVCTPGYSRVEFIAFFIADELNSLTYTIQNLYFMGCLYSNGFPRDTYSVCPSGSRWPYAILLCLPALARLVQCVKRWHDSRLRIHLINAGKYLSSIAQLCLFVLWRNKGRSTSDATFIVWVLISVITSTYTSAWDLIIDWSLFRPKSALLRQDRGYSSRYVYYLAMATNVLVRFIWVFYIPDATEFTNSRAFYFALAEMLRRWQWNFFRVETEHLGNADAYRVTREIPLPYRRVEHDSDEEENKRPNLLSRSSTKPSRSNTISVHLDRIRRELVGEDDRDNGDGGGGRNAPEEGDGKGRFRQREYEARKPDDGEGDEGRREQV